MYAVGIAFLVAEIFIPSSGILTVAGLAFLGAALYRTFQLSEQAGYIALLALIIALPTAVWLSVKYWYRTPMGKKISPPNPVLTEDDTGVKLDELETLVGQHGRSLTPLRPVGTCDFDGRRIECEAEVGMIESGVNVKAVGIRGRSLTVKPLEQDAQA